MKILLHAIIYLFTVSVLAQTVKHEVEDRIDASEMPAQAVKYIEQIKIKTKRLKYYLEEDEGKKGYEAKFKNNGKKYSVEFDDLGSLQDIEVRISESKTPEKILKTIEHYLNQNYNRFKIEKIQAQYLPLHANRAFTDKINPDAYELIVATKNDDNKLQKFEMTFNAQGKYIKSRKIIRRSYDFLLF